MLGNILLVILILVEFAFIVLGLLKRSNLKKEKSAVRIALFTIFVLLVISPIIDWSFRWVTLGLLLGVQALLGILVVVHKKENAPAKKSKVILGGLSRALLIGMAIMPAIMLPQYDEIKPSGKYSVGTVSYTWTDESREEYFTESDDKRKVSIQFWYPSTQSGQEQAVPEGKFPLIIFSHGSFGYRMSNYSTFQELASHGYIVGSIDHTYHAFMTKQEDGETIIVNMEFMNNAMRAENGDTGAEETYQMTQEWMKLRTEDMAFVLNYIKQMTTSKNGDAVFQSIDLDHIGLLGHSLGGATAAQIGREDKDVDAVIVVDGTMLGEIKGFENGKEIITDVPYPIPMMNMYNESHYKEALANQDNYANMIANKNALDSYQVVIEGSGHINFTDLPMVSPFLAKMLGTGDVDARYCIEKTNELILQFFDRYLKSGSIQIARERTF